jgi:hypothetical protein
VVFGKNVKTVEVSGPGAIRATVYEKNSQIPNSRPDCPYCEATRRASPVYALTQWDIKGLRVIYEAA